MSSIETRPARVPLSTYRFQFNLNFTFRDAIGLVPYLDALGISDLYASPYLKARSGSLHGYDISDHNRFNPEIGTEEEHAELSRDLRARGMGQLLDIVPNHMGVGHPENGWWMDVLENGPSSLYAPYFDIDWNPLKPELTAKVLLPVLGDQFGRVLERGELALRYEDSRFKIQYFEHWFPVAPKSTALVLRNALVRLQRGLPADDEERVELESIVTALEHLPPRSSTDPASVAERRRENIVTRRRVATLLEQSSAFREALEETITEINGRPGDPRSFDLLAELLEDQPYRLAFWRVAAEEINYRRFFDINDLAGVRVEVPEVFTATHRLILKLVEEGKVTGLRVDHPDGLYDPRDYLRSLQAECVRRLDGAPIYLLVEKILTGSEELPRDWPVAGTVGYEFLNRVNGLFVDLTAEREMTEIYASAIGGRPNFAEMVYQRKLLILRVSLASELNVLSYLLDRISERNRRYRDFTLGALTHALREIIACFPVYRSYIDAAEHRVEERDREYVERAVRLARRRNPTTSGSIFDFIRGVLLLDWPEDLEEEAYEEHARFVMKFQQLTGPVMAKGVEDTSFYLYNRLVSLNEVGGEPEHFGVAEPEFHRWMARRREHWPLAMNGSSTHDTKRSEDVRARIDVLSEVPGEWGDRVRRWFELNAPHRRWHEDESYPDPNAEYLLYQTLVGAWPLDAMDGRADEEFVGRIQQYMEKATREAKAHTSWINPNEEYDEALRDFVAGVLSPAADGGPGEFGRDIAAFAARLALPGVLNSLSQTTLKLTCPGVPDIYQGQELWDFSLVDPDNRRPVDYAERRRTLEELESRLAHAPAAALCAELVEDWRSGRIKMYLVRTLLHLRRRFPELFLDGSYLPLTAEGDHAQRVVAFARAHGEETLLVVVPRFWTGLLEGEGSPLEVAWGNTVLRLPAELPGGRYLDALTGTELELTAGEAGEPLAMDVLLRRFPVAVLRNG